MEREELLQKLYSAMDMIERILKCQEGLDEVQSKMDSISKSVETAKDDSDIIVTGLIIAFVIALLGLLTIKSFRGALICFFIGLIISSYVQRNFIYNKRVTIAEAEYDAAMPALIQQQKDDAEELEALWDCEQSYNMQELLPEEYALIDAIDWFIKTIKNQRADSLKEAINLYEDMLHKERLEFMQTKQIQLAQEQLTVAQAQERSAKKAADYAKQTAASSKKIAKSAKYGNVVNTVNTIHHWGDNKKKRK